MRESSFGPCRAGAQTSHLSVDPYPQSTGTTWPSPLIRAYVRLEEFHYDSAIAISVQEPIVSRPTTGFSPARVARLLGTNTSLRRKVMLTFDKDPGDVALGKFHLIR